MSPNIALTLAIFVATIALFVWDRLPVDVVSVLALLALALSGLLTPAEALAGFSAQAVLTIGAIFVVSSALYRTGAADRMGDLFLKFGAGSELRLQLTVMIGVSIVSAFMYNAPATAVLMPAVMVAARRTHTAPSRLMMPLCFGALLGGTLTLIGAAPNLIVSQALEANGQAPFHVFDLAPTGLIFTFSGIAYMILVGRHLLPNRDPLGAGIRGVERPEDLVSLYRLAERWHRLRIPMHSRLIGHTLADACLSCDYGITILGIERHGHVHGPISGDEMFHAGDILLAQGHDHDIEAAAAAWDAAYLKGEQPRWALADLALAEATLAPRSQLEKLTIGEVRFRQRYGVEVLGIWRGDRSWRSHLASFKLQTGDALLLQGPCEKINRLRSDPDLLILTGDRVTGRRVRKGPLCIAILAVCLGFSIVGVLPLALASLGAALLMVLTGCLLPDEVYRDVDWRILVMLGGTIALGAAMQKTGAALYIAQNLIEPVARMGDLPLLAVIFISSSVLSTVTSNAAAAVLMSPLALGIATRLGYEPHALLITVIMGVSTAFVTPFAHQANLIVMGPGNYRFSDYARVGALLSLVVFLAILFTLPLIWPLR